MILESGDVILVCNRRLFDGDEARYFVGRTIACEGALLKAEGYSFVKDLSNGHIVKKEEKRTKVISISSAGYILYQLPGEFDLESYDIVSGHADTALVAGAQRIMNLAEHTHCGQF
ncbi:MAG: hypothetical protein ACR2NP_07565 [Pirellulaceae bacterium]